MLPNAFDTHPAAPYNASIAYRLVEAYLGLLSLGAPMELYPPDDRFLIDLNPFGIPLAIHWYGVLIVSGALLGGWLAAKRAAKRGYDPEHVWNLLLLGMVLGIAGARAYYVAFEWPRFADQPLLFTINPANGGLAIHGALIGAILAALIYTNRNKLPFVEWLDICLPAVLVAQAIGRWGNFFNQEAYGQPTTLGFGVRIDQEYRLPPYNDMNTYPPNTLFHATFLYESLWNIAGFGLLVWIEKRLAPRIRKGDMAFLYAMWYGLGRFWIEGLRTDSLCTNGIGGSCEQAFRTAQVVSFILFLIGLVGITWNHLYKRPPLQPKTKKVVETRPSESRASEQGSE
jgi:phosphatidylglycerol---prolipoprotein diacylglyceryl transferase